jgi:hypothetical protein
MDGKVRHSPRWALVQGVIFSNAFNGSKMRLSRKIALEGEGEGEGGPNYVRVRLNSTKKKVVIKLSFFNRSN